MPAKNRKFKGTTPVNKPELAVTAGTAGKKAAAKSVPIKSSASPKVR